jgi:hypothetical protein
LFWGLKGGGNSQFPIDFQTAAGLSFWPRNY